MYLEALPLEGREQEEIRFVVNELRSLAPGLAAVPAGVAILLTPFTLLVSTRLLSSYPDLAVALMMSSWVALLVLTLVAQQWIKNRYNRRFGQVVAGSAPMPPRQRTLTPRLAAVLVVVIFLVAFLFRALRWQLPFEPILAGIAVSYALSWRKQGKYPPHLGVLALAMAATSVAMRLGPLPGVEPAAASMVIIGLLWIVRGVCDHRILVRTLHDLPEEPA